MSLTSRIQALTAYANEVTGESDTTLADAVATLAQGYGQGGGGLTLEGIANKSEPSGDIVIQGNVGVYAFYQYPNIRKVTVYGRIWSDAFNGSGATSAFLPNSGTDTRGFGSCNNLTTIVALSGGNNGNVACRSLRVADLINGDIAWASFQNCSSLTTLILRRSTSCTGLQYTNALDGTPFASGGSGGTIYIPKALYDELGTGSSLDYKSATNWSTIDGYGTITWAQIEGSIYETQYADGTPILQ